MNIFIEYKSPCLQKDTLVVKMHKFGMKGNHILALNPLISRLSLVLTG